MSNLAEKIDVAPTVPNNVVGYNNDSPQADINNFMALRNCENTRISYWNHYSHMFMNICNKECNKKEIQLTWDDIKLITKKRVKAYRVSMMKQDFANTTINQRVYACKKLWKEFIENDRVSNNAFDMEDLLEEENHYDSLTTKEIDLLYDYCLGLKHKPMTQKLYFEFLFTITCRKTIAQKLTWDGITREKDIDNGNEFWVVKYKGKTGNSEKAITDELYNRLKKNYTKEKEFSGKVFNINNHTLDKTLKNFCTKYGITRNIKQHSLKSSSADFIQEILEDINITALASDHGNVQTTYNSYINKNKHKKYSSQPSIILHQENYNIDMLKGLGEDVLIKLIKEAGKEVITTLCMKLEKLTK